MPEAHEAATAAAYDAMPYVGTPVATSHPVDLATMATLHGMTPPPVRRCRVLELGCADGGNTIPIALSLPEAEVVGIDLSPRQIADGRRIVAALGLRNVRLEPMSITDVDARLGTFDYVVCHGVYSWVPHAVQQRIFAICAERLSAQGVAYVSYNTYPGWHHRGLVRDMLRWHAGRFDGPAKQVAQARALLEFLAGTVPKNDSALARVLVEEANALRDASDAYVFHEHLEEVNEPLWFHQLVGRAAAHGLAYLGESTLAAMAPGALPDTAVAVVGELAGDLIEFEQYCDFLRGTTFRRSLFCRAGVPLCRPPTPAAVRGLLAASALEPQAHARWDGDGPVEFRHPNGETMTVERPAAKATLRTLGACWPRALGFDELRSRVADLAGGAADDDVAAATLLTGHRRLVVDLTVAPPAYAHQAGRRPVASPLARLQAHTSGRVTSLRHRTVTLDDFERAVVLLLDGLHDREAVVETVAERIGDGSLQPPAAERTGLREAVDQCLARLTRAGLLCA